MSSSVASMASSSTLGDILERVLDKGIVVAGDIKINLADVELLNIKIRLVICSVDKAMEMGINWWQQDPMLSSNTLGTAPAQLPSSPLSAADKIFGAGSSALAAPDVAFDPSKLEKENRLLKMRIEQLESTLVLAAATPKRNTPRRSKPKDQSPPRDNE